MDGEKKYLNVYFQLSNKIMTGIFITAMFVIEISEFQVHAKHILFS